MTSDTLKPCPNCGGERLLHDHAGADEERPDMIHCRDCDFVTTMDYWQSLPRPSDAIREIAAEMRVEHAVGGDVIDTQCLLAWADRLSRTAQPAQVPVEACTHPNPVELSVWTQWCPCCGATRQPKNTGAAWNGAPDRWEECWRIPAHGAPAKEEGECGLDQCSLCDAGPCRSLSGLVYCVEETRFRAEAAERERDGLRRCRDEHIDRADKYKARAETAEAEVERLREQLVQMQAWFRGANTQAIKLQSDLDSLRSKRDGLQAQLDGMDVCAAGTDEVIARLRAERDDANALLQLETEHYQEMLRQRDELQFVLDSLKGGRDLTILEMPGCKPVLVYNADIYDVAPDAPAEPPQDEPPQDGVPVCPKCGRPAAYEPGIGYDGSPRVLCCNSDCRESQVIWTSKRWIRYVAENTPCRECGGLDIHVDTETEEVWCEGCDMNLDAPIYTPAEWIARNKQDEKETRDDEGQNHSGLGSERTRDDGDQPVRGRGDDRRRDRIVGVGRGGAGSTRARELLDQAERDAGCPGEAAGVAPDPDTLDARDVLDSFGPMRSTQAAACATAIYALIGKVESMQRQIDDACIPDLRDVVHAHNDWLRRNTEAVEAMQRQIDGMEEGK